MGGLRRPQSPNFPHFTTPSDGQPHRRAPAVTGRAAPASNLAEGARTTPALACHACFGVLDGNRGTKRRAIGRRGCPRGLRRAGVCGAGVFALMRGSKGQIWQHPETHDLIRQAVGEAVAVAQAKGITLNPALPEEALNVFDSVPAAYKPSMLVDLEQGRRLEIEAWNGAIVRYGKQVGVSTPVNNVIYACLKPYATGRV